MAGLFFCLASAEGARLLFCPAAIQPHTSVYSVFCAVHANYTAHAAKQRTGLYRGFSCDLTYSATHDTRPTQAVIIQPAPRWSVSQRCSTSSAYYMSAPRRTLCSSVQPPYYNKVYKGAAVRPCYGSMPDSATHRRPCQPGGVSVPPTPGGLHWHRFSSHVAPPDGTLHPAGSPAAGARRAARNHWRLSAAPLFGLSPDSQ